MSRSHVLIPAARIERAILVIRGKKVLLDADLADIYGVSTARLNQQVRRNIDRFPSDFAFLLMDQEFADLKLHFATSSSGWGGRRKPPLAFTEHGAVMAASVLNTPVAVAASIHVVRVFVRLREMLASNEEFARKLQELEAKYAEHDQKFLVVFEAIRQLMAPPTTPKQGRIGFPAQPGAAADEKADARSR
jgi:ORF6N domain